jgi:hypothetical protein
MTPRAKVLLGLLAGVLLIALAGRLRPVPARRPAIAAATEERLELRSAAGRPGRPRATREAGRTAVVELDLARLTPTAGEFHPGRNPFAYYAPPPPPPPPYQGPSPEELRRQAEEAQQAAMAAAASEPPRPQPPPIDFAYLGSFGTPERRVAVFRNGTGALINALVGEVLDGKFRLVAIGYESVDIEYVAFPDLPPERVEAGQEGV